MTIARALRWPAALAASIGVHGGVGLAVLALMDPQPLPQQPVPKTKVEVASHAVQRTDAIEAQPDSETAAEAASDAARVGSDAVPQSRADALKPDGQTLAEADVPASQTAALAPESNPVSATAPSSDRARVQETSDPAEKLVAAQPESAPLVPQTASDNTASATLDVPATSLSELADPAPKAQAVTPLSDTVAESSAKSPQLNEAAMSGVKVPAAPDRAEPLETVQADVQIAALSLPDQPATALAAPQMVVAAVVGETEMAVLQQPNPQIAAAAAPEALTTASIRPDPQSVPAVLAAAAPVKQVDNAARVAPAQTPNPDALALAAPQAVETASLRPPAQSAPPVAASATDVPEATPKTDALVARLAWTGDGTADVSAVSLAAIQSFLQEGDIAAGAAVRDGIEGILAQVPCGRIQAAFQPETGALELRGHIPEDGLRGPVLAALQAQMGADIPVTDNLLILPRPQCGALAGIADVGLPQSTDQDNNPLLVGPSAHATVYDFREGQRLNFGRSQAPDYPSFIYLDYFDADGQVIHLAPNERVPLERFDPKIQIAFGPDSAFGRILDVRIGPPYGQEIAVAFAASVPVYEGVRPLVEPAAPYLVYLKERIARARAENPDFKGEWVYFFVSTRP